MDLLFATTNANKRREAARILGLDLESVALDLPEIQALDVAEVAAVKAKAAHAALGRPVMVEDSGLVVGAWNGLPGALTKWFVSSIGPQGILDMLGDGGDRSARAVCAVAVAGLGEGVEVFVGEVTGSLAREPRGESGFGWDPIFVPNGETRTYAEMGEAKHADSHRARALGAARAALYGDGGLRES
jgi:non-canonical purine NTP pyrophosphatase (RdgB/HAM1 family)